MLRQIRASGAGFGQMYKTVDAHAQPAIGRGGNCTRYANRALSPRADTMHMAHIHAATNPATPTKHRHDYIMHSPQTVVDRRVCRWPCAPYR